MKTFQIVLLSIFGALALLGLVLFATFGGFSSGAASVGQVSIWGTLPQERMDGIINSLRASNQTYTGVTYTERPAETFDADLAEAIASGSGPDLVVISQEELLSQQGKLQVIPYSTISERSFRDAYLPISELYLAQDGIYGIPFAVDPLVLYYNRSILTTSGVAVPPTTWEGITALAQQITQKQGNTISISTIPFGAYDNVNNARALLSLLIFQAGNPISAVTDAGPRARLTDTGASADGSPAASAISFYTQFADPVKTVYTWNRALANSRQSFLAGSLAFYPGFSSELPDLKAANPNLDFDMIPVPQPQTSSQRVTYARAYAFSVPKASKNPAGAVSVGFALAHSSQAAATARALTMAPATRVSLVPLSTDRYQPIYFPQALLAKGWLSPSPSVTDSIFSTMITNITSGRMSIGQALTSANQAIDASL